MATLKIELANGKEAGETLQTIRKELAAAAKEMNKATIGSKEFVDSSKKYNEIKDRMKELTTQQQATNKASEEMKKQFGGILNLVPGFSQATGALGAMKEGVGGLTSGFGILKGAIAATGFGLLIIAVSTLVDWFKKTDEGATLLGGIFRGFGVIMDMLFKKFRDVGGALFDAFNNPKQAIIDLWEFIKENFMNRIKGIMVVFEALRDLDMTKLTDGLIQVSTGITDATDKLKQLGKTVADTVKEGIELEAEFDRIEDRARELAVTQAESEKQISQLLLQSKNVGLTYQQRIALLDKAGAIETANHEAQMQNAIDYEKAVKREVEIAEATGKVTDDLDKKYKDAQIARINLEKSSIDSQEKIANRRTALMEKELTDLEKVNAEIEKRNEKQQQFADKRMKNDEEREAEHWRNKGAIAMNGAAANLAQKILLDKMATDEERKAYADREQALKEHLERVKQNEEQAKQMMIGQTVALGMEVLNARINNSKAELQLIKDKYGAESLEYKRAAAKEGERIKEWERNKLRLNLIGEISTIWKNAAEFGPFATIVAGIQTAAALVRFNQGSQNINRMKFETGGPVVGPRHSEGGVAAELEGGEFVFSRKSVNRIGVGLLDSINRRLTFADGGMVPKNPYESSTAAARASAQSGAMGMPELIDYQKLGAVIYENMKGAIYSIRVTNNLTETKEGLTTLVKLQNEWDV